MADLQAQRHRVAVVGGSGYTGGELIRLLLDHPHVDVTFVSAERNAGAGVGAVHPALRNHPAVGAMSFRPLAELEDVDVAFGCLPSGALPGHLDLVAERAKRVINVAGDFRLHDAAELAREYPASVGSGHEFAYYVPELMPVPDSRFVNLPGCMAVASVYALYPLFEAGLVEPRVIVDAKTGSTGGGREATEHHAERAGNFRVHKPHGHRHTAEIRQAVQELTGTAPDLQFSTHSLDVARGIMVTAYSTLLPGVEQIDVKRAFAKAYVKAPFVRVRTAPKRPSDYPMLGAVIGTNVAEVAVAQRDRSVVSVVAIDNLLKGASGQAVQAMNLLLGLDETVGLPRTALVP